MHSEKLRVCIVRIQDFEKEVADALAKETPLKTIMAIYDKLLMELNDAHDVFKAESKDVSVREGVWRIHG